MNRIYKDKPIVYGNVTVASLVRRINNKCELYDLSWFLEGKGAGRNGKTLWIGNRG